MPRAQRHTTGRMVGRDPAERHRSATPLELLFDLTFVIAFGIAADELAHYLAEGHLFAGIVGFSFATFAVSWAWISFAWFASAYDTDDWIFRLLTLLQMLGVLILALGLPTMFESLDEGRHVDNKVMVLGYIVMRVPMVAQWLRAARQDPEHRHACLEFVKTIVISQIGWTAILFADLSIGQMFALATLPLLVELAGPVLAERRFGGIPWHPHHIAERYGLLAIIALGEGLLGTMAALSAIVGPHGPGWSWQVAVLGVSGTALTFGMWWVYFVLPCGDLLAAHRERSIGWGYGQMAIFGAIVAVGAGLHVAAYWIEHHTTLDARETVLTVAVPLAVYILGIYALYTALTRTFDPFHVWLIAGSAALLVLPVLLADAGWAVEWSLAILALTPWVTVVGYETVGHRHNAEVLAALEE